MFSKPLQEKILIVLFTILCTSSMTNAQQLIKGIVVDSASFAPLPYVTVKVKNELRGTTTDVNGNFSLLATERDTLVFTLVGHERLEYPLIGYEPSMIRMAEKTTLLNPVIIRDSRLDNLYEGMFDEQNARLKKRIPFYYSKTRKDKIKAAHWRDEMVRVQTYVEVVINNPETKATLMKTYMLSENEYYTTLAAFNEKHYSVMYYLTAAELMSLLNNFFAVHAPKR